MRLFVAVDPPGDVVADLDALAGDRDETVRWVPPAQWHITLAFFGEVVDERVAELSERLARAAARTSPLTLALRGAGTFPRQPAKARVVWIGVEGDVPELTRLAERVAAAGRRTGIDVEDRSFRPHLTVARARRAAVDAREVVARLAECASRPWDVGSLRLVRSTLGANVRHETLAEFALAGAHQA